MIELAIIFCLFLIFLLGSRRSYPLVIAATVPIYAWLWWVISRPLPTTDNWGDFDRGIISIALFFGIIPAVWRLSLARRGDADFSPEINWKPTQISCLFVAIWLEAWLLTPAIPSAIGAAACSAACLALTIALFGIASIAPRYRLFLITAGTALITGTVAVLIWPLLVVTAAEKRAAERPYCLVVAYGNNYRTAENLLDLTPLIMRGREGGKSASNFHGQLLVYGESRRNWSYERIDFFDTSSDNKPPRCKPTIGFARNLPWL